MGMKKTNAKMFLCYPKCKLNSTEKIIAKAPIDSNNNHLELTLTIKEDQNYFRIKDRIRSEDDALNNIERERLIQHGKRIRQNVRLTLKFV